METFREKTFRSITLYKFEEGVNVDESVKLLEKQAKEKKFDIVVHTECGVDYLTPEVLRHGFTHIFMMTFTSKKDFTAYRSDPENVENSATFQQKIKDVLMFNYEAHPIKLLA